MIESSFSSSSCWDLDPLQNFSDIPYLECDDCVEHLGRNSSILSNISCNDSSNGSDDSVYFGDLDKAIPPITDAFLSEILESSSIDFQDEWSFLQDVSLPVESSSPTIRDSPKKSEKSSEDYLSSKLWSKMSLEEQHETLHSLSKIVTLQMDIADQIRVIKIIDPSVTISPNDTEFALDFTLLNDAKLKRIQELVRKHKFSLSNSNKKFKSSSKNISPQKSSLSSKIVSRRTNSKAKRKQKKQTDTDEDIQQKRKLELHGQKEVQSGLFVYEKVIKLSNPLEDEDVNILE